MEIAAASILELKMKNRSWWKTGPYHIAVESVRKEDGQTALSIEVSRNRGTALFRRLLNAVGVYFN